MSAQAELVEPAPAAEPQPPRRLSNRTNAPDYHPSYLRVGVLFDGQERRDVARYDADAGMIWTIGGMALSGKVEPFWRFAESRQQRRARERWEGKRK